MKEKEQLFPREGGVAASAFLALLEAHEENPDLNIDEALGIIKAVIVKEHYVGQQTEVLEEA